MFEDILIISLAIFSSLCFRHTYLKFKWFNELLTLLDINC